MSSRLKWQDKIFARTLLTLIPKSVHPNHLTIARFILTPIVAFLALQQYYIWALVAFLLVAFTDTLDGSMARVRKQESTWGEIYDPVADKLLIGSLVVILVIQHLSYFLGIAIIVIELLFIGLGWFWVSNGQVVQANRWGKIKMFFQIVGVTMLLLGLIVNFQGLFDISATTFYLALVFAIISLFTSGV